MVIIQGTTGAATTVWGGTLLEGEGQVTLNTSGIGVFPVPWPARSAEPNGVISPEELITTAEGAKEGCPVSQALKAVPIKLLVE